MVYDTASKRLAEIAPAAFLSFLLGRPIDPRAILNDLPQEMPTLNRADQVWRVKLPGEKPFIILLESLTHWKADKLLDIALYQLWLRRKHRLRVFGVILISLPSANVQDVYEDEDCRHQFHVVKLWEEEATAFIQAGEVGLYPLVPLMKGGAEWAEEAAQQVLRSRFEKRTKGDLIAMLGLFLGLTDKGKGANFVQRSEFMNVLAESPVAEIFKKQGALEGWKKGREEGHKEGIEEGRLEGLLEAARVGLDLRFGRERRESLDPDLEKCGLAELEETLAGIRAERSFRTIQKIVRAK